MLHPGPETFWTLCHYHDKKNSFFLSFFFMVNPSQCQAVHEVQSATYAKQYMQTTYAFSIFFSE